MLTLSQNAATLLVETRSQQGIPADATLRVAPTEHADETGITLGFVEAPHNGDRTGTAQGMPICVDAQVADALDSVTIDVDTTSDEPRLVFVHDDA